MWTLQSVEPDNVRLTFRMLPGTSKTLGRATRADFVVDTPLVSRIHCRFALTDGDRLELEDLSSTNGTFVNGSQIRVPTGLRPGDVIELGAIRLQLVP